MGQYYMAYVRNGGESRVYCPQNAIYLTRNGLASAAEIGERKTEGFWDDFSGLKLKEHSWMPNRFCNGVLEQIWDNPSRVAWVGDYADETYDFDGRYTEDVYNEVWNFDTSDNEMPFDRMPHVHQMGMLVNRTKGVCLDLADYADVSTFAPTWDEGGVWCFHPLPLLTCIGNGRGSGDYHGTNMGKVGSWAMDEIEYTLDLGRLEGIQRLAARDYRFVEE